MNTQTLVKAVLVASTGCMLAFLYLFVLRNAPGLTSLSIIIALATVYGLFYLLAAGRLIAGVGIATGNPILPGVFVLISSVLLVYIFLQGTVLDYYQPLSLYDDVIAALALWWGLLILAGLVSLVAARQMLSSLLRIFLLSLMVWPLAVSLWWINYPKPGSDIAANTHVFVGGENGYDTYRIPGLALIATGSRLANGEVLSTDRILAFAEARRDAALDDGVVDLVLKISDNGGVDWSRQAIICSHKIDKRRGKCGNPTPVFDHQSGRLILAFNLSGLEADTGQHSSHIMVSEDGGLSWGDARQLADDNFIFGPGKGIQKSRPPNQGSLLLPGHAGDMIYLLVSEDGGVSWRRSGALQGGDETDVAELADGGLYLAARHQVPISRAPEPNGRLFSISPDGGDHWSSFGVDEQLPTPVCQASIISGPNGSLLFSNPAHYYSRVRMTIRMSLDSGDTWSDGLLVFAGPSGYSVLALGSDGGTYTLYENGNMAYSERISLARIEPGVISELISNKATYNESSHE